MYDDDDPTKSNGPDGFQYPHAEAKRLWALEKKKKMRRKEKAKLKKTKKKASVLAWAFKSSDTNTYFHISDTNMPKGAVEWEHRHYSFGKIVRVRVTEV